MAIIYQYWARKALSQKNGVILKIINAYLIPSYFFNFIKQHSLFYVPVPHFFMMLVASAFSIS